ncbi:MAG: hypothetical protein KF857_05520 [Fimbriimonadaceae bacterium]|nr:hypothetical protein [Fimbriimonadaceae bacterium]
MPELPDIELYRDAIAERVVGSPLVETKFFNPFVLRTVTPKAAELSGKEVTEIGRLGKRVVIHVEGGLCLVVHLMVAGRFLWAAGEPKVRQPGGRNTLALFQFPAGHLLLTEAGSKRRASVHVVRTSELSSLDPGGVEPLTATLEEFRAALTPENHTVKRALTNPRYVAGIGNAYSDEILHAARVSPVRQTRQMTDAEWVDLHLATQSTLVYWRDKLRAERKGKFPGRGQVTAFRPDFAAHGKFGCPCPVCGDKIERIRYADNETNYCPTCQCGGKVLADRALSRLLGPDWAKKVEALDED